MAGGVGQLKVGLGLDYAEYTAGLNKAQAQAQQFATNFKASFGGNLAAGFTRDIIRGLAQIPGRLVDVVKGSIDAADHLNDLSKSTGVAVETLGGIGFAASQAGSSLDGAADAIGKLNLTLAKAAGGNREAAESLKALGVDALDPLTGKTIAVDKALVQIANTLEKAADSPEKFRAAAGALGKQYRELVPLLQDGGKALLQNIAYYQRFGGISTETAQKADEFNDTLGKINLLTSAFSRTLASELLTPLQGIAGAFLQAKEKGDGFKGAAVGIKEALIGIAETASFVVNSIAAISARLGGLVQKGEALRDFASKQKSTTKNPLDIFGTGGFSLFGNKDQELLGKQFDAINAGVKKEVGDAQAEYDEFSKRLREGSALPATPAKGGRIAGIPDAAAINAAAAAAEAALRKNLDGLLKTITLETNQQQNALAFASRFLEGEYQDKLIGLGNFYDDQSNIRKRALQVQLDEQDRIIAAEQAFLKATRNPTAKIEAGDRIKDAETRKTGLRVQFGQDEQLAIQQRAREAKALEDAFAGVNAQVLDLRENFVAAAEVKFDLQFDALSKTFTANGNAAGQEAIATLRAATLAQAALQKASLDASRTLDALAIQEERIALSVQIGALTSLEALAREGDARRKIIPVYEAQVEALAAIARASGRQIDLENLERARLALDRLKASADPLAESLNKTFGGDFNSALDDFVTGTKNASDAFKAFAKSVLNDILKMGSKSITESIFGGSGGAGGFLSDLFKNQGGAGAAPAGGLVGLFGSLLGKGSTTTAAAPAADDGTTAGIKATVAALGGLTTSAATASETMSQQTVAVAQSIDGFAGLGASLTSTADAFGSFITDFGSSLGDFLSSLFSSGSGGGGGGADWASLLSDFAGAFAGGGQIMPGQWGVVGENGPELAFGGRTGKTIQPASGGQTQNISVTVQGAPGQSRDSAMQQGAAIGLGIQKAMARNT